MSHPVSENDDTLGRTAPGFADGGADLASSEDTVVLPPTTSPTTTAPGGVSLEVSDETFASADQGQDATSEASSSKADAAKEQGQQVKDEALEGGKHVAGVASEQGQSVLAEAGDQAQDLMGQARSQLASQAATQQENLTTWLRSLADELHQMVDRGSDQGSSSPSDSSPDGQHRVAASSGVATNAVSQAQGRVKEAADWLEKHDPGDLVDEATRFARRRPGAFLAIAAVGGLLVGRFTRGLKDDTSSSTTPPSGTTSDTAGSATAGGHSTLGHDATNQRVDQPDVQGSGLLVSPVAPASAGFGAGDPVGQEPR